MHRLDSRPQQNKIFAIIICVAVFAIPVLMPKQPSVALDAFCWIISMVISGAALVILAPRTARFYLFLTVFGWLVVGVGLAEFSAVFLCFVSAWCLGVLVLRRLYSKEYLSLISITEAVLIGATIWLAIWGGMLHFAVNYQSLHIVLCSLPCILLANRASSIRNELRSRVSAAQGWMNSIPLWAWVAGLAVIGWVLRWTSFPSMGYDDHALHLRIWTELLTQQYYDFDIHTQIWSVAPFVVDLLHAGLSLIAGHDARGAMNLALTFSLLLLMGRILCFWRFPSWAQWLLIVLMASTPMLGNLLLSLQTELTLAVLAIAGMRLVIDANGGWRGQHVLGVLSCAALCAGIKLPGTVLGVTLLATLALRWWSQRERSTANNYVLRWPAFLLLIPLSFVALHSYALAWKVTGNPVFPLYNAIFLSPFFSTENFSDSRWIHGFSILSYFRTFFYTSEFFESGNYTAGWQYLFLLPPAIFAGFRPGMPNGLRIALVPLFGFGLVMFSATQYWRYLFPVMPIAGVLFASLFVGANRNYRVLWAALTVACVVLNLVFFPKVSWMMNSSPAAAITNDGKESIMSLYAPAALLTERVNQFAPGSRVLYPSSAPYGATLNGTPLYVNWYSRLREARFGSLKSKEEIGEFIAQEKVDFVITNMADARVSGSPEVLLRDYLASFGSVIAQEGPFILYRLTETPLLYRKVFDLAASVGKTPGEIELLLPFSEQGIQASQEPKHLAVIQTYRSNQARYSIDFNCLSGNGYFVAQINWNKGAAYYRLVACNSKNSKKLSFAEVVPIPVGASTGMVYVTARDSDFVYIENLSIEVR